jgi:hypothetical protein
MLSKTALLNGLRLLVALAVMLGVSPLREGGFARPGDGAAQVPNLSHSHATALDHSHNHDEDTRTADQMPSHGHQYQDHSHVALGLAPPAASLGLWAPGTLVRVHAECRATSDPPYRLDRPPCLVVIT